MTKKRMRELHLIAMRDACTCNQKHPPSWRCTKYGMARCVATLTHFNKLVEEEEKQ